MVKQEPLHKNFRNKAGEYGRKISETGASPPFPTCHLPLRTASSWSRLRASLAQSNRALAGSVGFLDAEADFKAQTEALGLEGCGR